MKNQRRGVEMKIQILFRTQNLMKSENSTIETQLINVNGFNFKLNQFFRYLNPHKPHDFLFNVPQN